jgi:hypothetical protein
MPQLANSPRLLLIHEQLRTARLAGKKGLEARYAFRVLVSNLALAPEELWRGYNRRARWKTESPNGNTIWPPMIFACKSFSPANQPSAAHPPGRIR